MDPGVCIRCARNGPTCCRLTPGQEDFCFPLSDMERDRILDLAPHKGAFAVVANSSAFVDSMLRLFPAEEETVRALFPEKKVHFRLATDRDGRCKHLGPTGCMLPIEARPYYCRLFPIWFTGGRPSIFAAPGCLAAKEAPNVPRLFEAVHLTPVRARDLHSRLRLAWGLPPREGMPAVPKAFARFSR